MSRGAAFALFSLLLLSCATGPIPNPSPAPTATASGIPAPSATAAPTRAPSPSPSDPPTLHVGGMATVVEPQTVYFDPLERGTSAPLGRVHPGEQLYLVDGPLVAGEREFWQIHPGPYNQDTKDLGWVAAADGDGTAALIPDNPDCPTSEPVIDADTVEPRGDALLLSCFGDESVTAEGDLYCTYGEIDTTIGGPIFDNERTCRIGGFAAYGSAVTSLVDEGQQHAERLIGRFRLTGHFDDPGAQSCGEIPFGTGGEGAHEPDPRSVMFCRTLFVVEDAVPLAE